MTDPIIDPTLLMNAYRSGIFPMADSRDDPEVYWIEPRLRGILPLDGFHCSRSLARTLKRGRITVTCNQAFEAVMEECAAPRPPKEGEEEDDFDDLDDLDPGDSASGTWISHRIAATYHQLHRLGHAHSIECWIDAPDGTRQLVGGLYGVGFDRVFCGESMFSRVPDASKVALAWLVAALRIGGADLLDCQFMTGHLSSLGAVEISQAEYLTRLYRAQRPEGAEYRAPTMDMGQAGDSTQSGAAGAAGACGAGASWDAGALSLPDAFGALLAAAKSSGFSSSPGKLIAQSLTQTS
ncbi:leucyl/phenylalanyl-tRNA--protein transferase [Novosphingobium sp. FSY-8]|uniref:Leucyl/phenylalanyl-tRNA--protein transferase n=1 Tax=Novosphingobium ovatum TaxID=1908523 RepID=A0ABW9X937_9SPHN|nr:leucyl/phenylalanyl-tRNA--protein transferase [Novosphingobium ovatum]